MVSKWEVLKRTWANFYSDQCPRSAAALSYYTLFSLPPLLVIAITIAGYVANLASLTEDGDARRVILREARQTLGEGAAEQIDNIIDHASKAPRSVLGILIATVVFLFGASGVMVQLQSSLNEVWQVQPAPQRRGLRTFVVKRLLSFLMVLAAGLVLLMSMVVSAVFAMVGDQLRALLPAIVVGRWPLLISNATNLIVTMLVFAVMFKWLPDARIAWRDVWTGAMVTSLLFVVGKWLLAIYFARAEVGSSYGAAGSLALILLWVYYSGMIFLFGAEFTHAVALSHASSIAPEEGAIAVKAKG